MALPISVGAGLLATLLLPRAACFVSREAGEAAADKREVRVPGWPDISGKVPFSWGIATHDRVIASGMMGFDMAAMKIVPGGVVFEVRQALQNVQQIFEAGGTDMKHVTECRIFLSNMADLTAVNEVYKTFFQKPYPTRTAVQMASLAVGSVEVKCSAVLPSVAVKQVVVEGWPDMSDSFPLSSGLVAGGFIYASGVVGMEMHSGQLVEGGIVRQTRQALSNAREIIEAGGASLADVVGCTVYLKDASDFSAMNEAYTGCFPRPQPSRVATQVAALAGPASVEIQCFAALRSLDRKQVVVPSWPDLSGKFPFSTAMTAGGLLFASGLQGVDWKTMKVVPGGVEAETAKALSLVKELVEAGGSSMADVLECDVYLRDMKDFAAMNAVYAPFFPRPLPTHIAVQVGGIVGGAAVEIQCTAVLQWGDGGLQSRPLLVV